MKFFQKNKFYVIVYAVIAQKMGEYVYHSLGETRTTRNENNEKRDFRF